MGWPLPGVVPDLSLVFFVNMLSGVSGMGGLGYFSCGANVIVTNFVG